MDSEKNIEKNSESGKKMVVGIAADHGGFELKERISRELETAGYDLVDFGATDLVPGDDFPDYVIPLSMAVGKGEIRRGLAICASGVGACVTANKIPGVRAALITDTFSAHQGVEDDNMNIMCLGGQITGYALAMELVFNFLNANFKEEERFKRRLRKMEALEKNNRKCCNFY